MRRYCHETLASSPVNLDAENKVQNPAVLLWKGEILDWHTLIVRRLVWQKGRHPDVSLFLQGSERMSREIMSVCGVAFHFSEIRFRRPGIGYGSLAVAGGLMMPSNGDHVSDAAFWQNLF